MTFRELKTQLDKLTEDQLDQEIFHVASGLDFGYPEPASLHFTNEDIHGCEWSDYWESLADTDEVLVPAGYPHLR